MLAIIPARGGSKGLPGKNIKMLCGKPLIAYTIEAALNAKCISRVIVSTDSEKIAEIARQYGAEVPFIRPENLSSDTAMAVDVYIHAIEFMESDIGEKIEKFCVLLPTAPLRTAEDIDKAYREFSEKDATTLISVCEAETPPSWYLIRDGKERIKSANLDSGSNVQNRQTNKQYFVPNGAIYILDKKLLKKKRTYYCDNTIAYVMSRKNSIDIDELLDFEFAEYILKNS